MINIIKSDSYRIFRGTAIYIAIGIMLLTISISIYNIQPGFIGNASVGDINIENFKTSNYDEVMSEYTSDDFKAMSLADYRQVMFKVKGYKLDRDILGTNINLYYVFIFAAALAVTVDFSGSSIKNTLTSAISRKKYFISKLIFINLMCLIFLFANTYIMYFANIIFNTKQFSSDISEITKITVMQIPPVLALAAVLTGIAFITRKTAVYNTVTIPLIMVIQLVLNLVASALSLKEKYLQYELQLMLAKLANNPTQSYMINAYLLCGGIIVLFYTSGWLSFSKAEIK